MAQQIVDEGVILTMSQNLRNALEQEGIDTEIVFAFPSGDDRGRFYVRQGSHLVPPQGLNPESFESVKVSIVKATTLPHEAARVCRLVCNANGCRWVCV